MTEQAAFDDPTIVLFQRAMTLQPGEVRLHGVKEVAERVFGRSLEDVKADWRKVTGQIREMMNAVEAEAVRGLALDTVTVSLGFSLQGKLVFIAEAGVEASVSMTFKRS